MYLLLLTLITTCSLSFVSSSQVCNEAWTFCLPISNSTWYHHNQYQFIWNKNHSFLAQNNNIRFDIHLLTLSTKTERRTIKSWFNLTSATDSLTVQVADDWFPNTLPSGAANKTWTVYAFLLAQEPYVVSPVFDETSYAEFKVVQSPPIPIIVVKNKDSSSTRKWTIIIIVVVTVIVVLLAICITVWLYKNMQKQKKKALLLCNNMNSNVQSSILSTPDARMIADSFRQAMSNSDIVRHQIGEDLLKRQLESEGTSVSEVERRTPSTKHFKKSFSPQ